MHEMALTRNVVDMVVAEAESAHAARVTSVTLTIGCMRDIVEDLFEGLFEFLAKGTVAEGAELILLRAPLLVKCEDCGMVYSLNVFESSSWSCPSCNHENYRIISGTQFNIENISITTEEKARGLVA